MVTLSMRPRRTLDSVGWSVPQRRAASSCVSFRLLMVSLMAVMSLLFAVAIQQLERRISRDKDWLAERGGFEPPRPFRI
jgi:hypothetical protein